MLTQGGFLLHLRRSACIYAFPLMLGALILNFIIRTDRWHHEWLLAAEQLNYATLMIGPILGAAAAWDGYQLNRRRDRVALGVRGFSAVIVLWATHLATVVILFFIGFAILLAGTFGSAGPIPGWPATLTLLPAVALLGLEAAVGLAIGVSLSSVYAAPLAAVAIYVTSIFLYVKGPIEFISIGGASESLAAFKPIYTRQFAQEFFYISLALLLILLTTSQFRRSEAWLRGLTAGTGAAFVLSLVLLLPFNGDRFVQTSASLDCSGTAPSICMSAGYEDYRQGVAATAQPVWETLARKGVHLPRSLDQSQLPGNPRSAPLDASILEAPTASDITHAIVLANVSKTCPITDDPATIKDFGMVSWWLAREAGSEEPSPYRLPSELQGSVEEQVAWINAAMERLRECR